MSLPEEKARAVNNLAVAVLALAPYLHGKGERALVPRQLIANAFACLRHYPAPYEVELRFGKDHE